jgi:hypothetical protein
VTATRAAAAADARDAAAVSGAQKAEDDRRGHDERGHEEDDPGGVDVTQVHRLLSVRRLIPG